MGRKLRDKKPKVRITERIDEYVFSSIYESFTLYIFIDCYELFKNLLSMWIFPQSRNLPSREF